jgi:hypothetical protein
MLLVFIIYIVPCCLLIPLITGFIKYKFFDTTAKIAFWYLLYMGIANAINMFLSARRMNDSLLFNITTPIEFVFVSFFYRDIFRGWNRTILWIICIFTLFCIIDFFVIQAGNNVINSYSSGIENFLIASYAVTYFNQQSVIDHDDRWSNNSINWINIAFLIYCSSGICMFVFVNYLTKAGAQVNHIVWSVFDIILIIQYLLFAVGFYKCKA